MGMSTFHDVWDVFPKAPSRGERGMLFERRIFTHQHRTLRSSSATGSRTTPTENKDLAEAMIALGYHLGAARLATSSDAGPPRLHSVSEPTSPLSEENL